MKKKLYIGVFLAAALTGMSSCKDEAWNQGLVDNGDTGELNMTDLAIDVSEIEKVINVDASSGTRSRAASYDINTFHVAILSSEGATLHDWTYSSCPEVVSLAAGKTYTVQVYSHKVQPAEWEKPYFHASKNVTIQPNAIERLGTFEAKLANAAVSVRIDDSLKKYCGDDVQVEVKANNSGVLTYAKDETRKGYFQIIDGSTTLVVSFSGTINGYKENVVLPATDIEAAQHRIYTFRAKTNTNPVPDETGNVDPSGGIGIDVKVVDEDVDGDITLEEDVTVVDPSERPDYEAPEEDPGKDPNEPDNPDNPDNPSEEAATFSAPAGISDLDLDGINNFMDFGDGETFPGTKKAVMLIECPGKISKLVVKITSNYLTKDFMESINLSDEFDLANPGQFEEGLTGLDLLEPGKPIKGQTQATFDVTQLAPMLSIGAEPNDNHSFMISVTNEAGKTSSHTLVFSDHN